MAREAGFNGRNYYTDGQDGQDKLTQKHLQKQLKTKKY